MKLINNYDRIQRGGHLQTHPWGERWYDLRHSAVWHYEPRMKDIRRQMEEDLKGKKPLRAQNELYASTPKPSLEQMDRTMKALKFQKYKKKPVTQDIKD